MNGKAMRAKAIKLGTAMLGRSPSEGDRLRATMYEIAAEFLKPRDAVVVAAERYIEHMNEESYVALKEAVEGNKCSND